MDPPSKRRLHLNEMSKKRLLTSHPNSQTDNTSSEEEFDIEINELNDEESIVVSM